MQTKRRSIYALGKNINSLQADIIKTIKNCVKHCPSPFNVQSARVVVLLGKYQQEFWNMTFGAIENVAPPEKISAAKSKIDSFAAAYGTILFFEDKHSLDELKKQFPPFKSLYHC